MDGAKEHCTDSNGYGSPFLEGNDIVFPINREIKKAEIVWPQQKNKNRNNWAQISELKFICTKGKAYMI